MLPTAARLLRDLTDPDPVDALKMAEREFRVGNWWAAADLPERWPLDTATAAQLLRDAGDYAVDEADLLDFVARGLMPLPSVDESGNPEWDALDVKAADLLLKRRQQWQPLTHDSEKHPAQLRLEAERAAGTLADSLRDGLGMRLDVTDVLTAL